MNPAQFDTDEYNYATDGVLYNVGSKREDVRRRGRDVGVERFAVAGKVERHGRRWDLSS